MFSAIDGRHAAVGIFSIIVVGCTTIGPSRVVSFDTKPIKSALVLIPSATVVEDKNDNWKNLYADQPRDLPLSDDERWVAAQCDAVEPVGRFTPQSIEAFFIGLIVDWVLGQVEHGIQAQIDGYSTVYQATAVSSIYATGANSVLLQPPTLSIVCFRFVHGEYSNNELQPSGRFGRTDSNGRLCSAGQAATTLFQARILQELGKVQDNSWYCCIAVVDKRLAGAQSRQTGKRPQLRISVHEPGFHQLEGTRQVRRVFSGSDLRLGKLPLLALPPASIDWNDKLVSPEPVTFTDVHWRSCGASINPYEAPRVFRRVRRHEIGDVLKDAVRKSGQAMIESNKKWLWAGSHTRASIGGLR